MAKRDEEKIKKQFFFREEKPNLTIYLKWVGNRSEKLIEGIRKRLKAEMFASNRYNKIFTRKTSRTKMACRYRLLKACIWNVKYETILTKPETPGKQKLTICSFKKKRFWWYYRRSEKHNKCPELNFSETMRLLVKTNWWWHPVIWTF